MAILDWGRYNYDTEKDKFICKKCKYETQDEDEIILHLEEHIVLD